MRTLVTADNIEIGKKVIDGDGNTGTIMSYEDLHNVVVEYDGGGGGLHCLVEGCKERHAVGDKIAEVIQYDPLYYFTQEDMNEKIHEFMGHDWKKENFQWRPGSSTSMTLKYLEHYKTSWGWLMPVVQKIVSQKYDDGERVFVRTFGTLNEETGGFMVRFNRCGLFEAETALEAMYLAVCDYVVTKQRAQSELEKTQSELEAYLKSELESAIKRIGADHAVSYMLGLEVGLKSKFHKK